MNILGFFPFDQATDRAIAAFNFLENTQAMINKIKQAWSSFYVPGKRYISKPVYILTSHATFSAGEAFAYLSLCKVIKTGYHRRRNDRRRCKFWRPDSFK